MAFLADLPAAWISRRRAARWQPGWTPFAGQLSLRSHQHALHIASGFFEWLVQAGYLALNPWRLVRRRLGDDARRSELDSRAFTREAWAQLQGFVEAAPPSPSRERIRFLLGFCEATGLRASELVAARLRDLRLVDGRWALAVHGKGARNRVVAVPGQAQRALQAYLAARGLPPLEQAPGEAPLVASAEDPTAAVALPLGEELVPARGPRCVAARGRAPRRTGCATSASRARWSAAPRWPRRSARPDTPTRRTTMRYARTQLAQLQDEMEGVFS